MTDATTADGVPPAPFSPGARVAFTGHVVEPGTSPASWDWRGVRGTVLDLEHDLDGWFVDVQLDDPRGDVEVISVLASELVALQADGMDGSIQ